MWKFVSLMRHTHVVYKDFIILFSANQNISALS